ncbi:hypothetical protein CSA56_09075 [candidate division KSB3 bacterium]|uniref:Uncharacterized protein n=1 Tax=candidate division KSB3 bacterium TaxID=2044937 RepID=A0A2G6KEG0_9BACT|nr:MAG: hypothetical protein CSA56_09075 [candidate division KSB3 bacterium]
MVCCFEMLNMPAPKSAGRDNRRFRFTLNLSNHSPLRQIQGEQWCGEADTTHSIHEDACQLLLLQDGNRHKVAFFLTGQEGFFMHAKKTTMLSSKQ